MFQRFTKEAREAVVVAHEEATALRDDEIGAVHIVLAVSGARGGVAGPALRSLDLGPERLRQAIAVTPRAGGQLDRDALASLGIDLDQVRRQVEAAFGEGALERRTAAGRGRRRGNLPFSRHAKQALELSLREALRLGHNYIGSEHVVLGALRAGDPALQAVLRGSGRSPDEVRAAVLAALDEPHAATG